jgi:DNA-binding transcriptional LysR family regulator
VRLDAIRSFLKLIETGSYAAAAEALFMSPTTLHSHVKTLEEELSDTLVTFEGRRLELTRVGAQFLIFAERTIGEYDAMRDDLSGLSRPPQTTLRVVALPAPGTHLVPPVVRAFQDANPEAHVIVDTRHTGEALAALVSRQAELAILHDVHAEHARDIFESTLVFEDHLAAIVRKDCYHAPDVSLLEEYPLAIQPPPSTSRRYVEEWARGQQIKLQAFYEHTAFDGILSYVMAGRCVGFVGGYLARLTPFAETIQALDLPAFESRRRFVALYRPRAGRRALEFIDFFREFYGVAEERGRS